MPLDFNIDIVKTITTYSASRAASKCCLRPMRPWSCKSTQSTHSAMLNSQDEHESSVNVDQSSLDHRSISNVTSPAPVIDTNASPTFHPFPRLPLELRTQIWTLALVDQPPLRFELRQALSASVGLNNSQPPQSLPTFCFLILVSQSARNYQPPVHLAVCQESRLIVTENYLAFPRACRFCTEKLYGGYVEECMSLSTCYVHPVHDIITRSTTNGWDGWVKNRRCIFSGDKTCKHAVPHADPAQPKNDEDPFWASEP